MFGNTEAITVEMAKLALDAASLRHQAIAHNIANANSPGFAPVRVSFEDQLGAVRAALRDPFTAGSSSISNNGFTRSRLAVTQQFFRHVALQASTS